MAKPTLLIMAAGIGSRYGTLKQIDRVGPSGETILDYSVYDAMRAGFERVVFIIRRDIEKDFREVIFNTLEKHIPVDYVFQELSDLPGGYSFPSGRIKPWGTGHAIWSARHRITTPFVAINADDFYGYTSFRLATDFFRDHTETNSYCLIGFRLKNTLSEHGHVSRGVCKTDQNGLLERIDERLQIVEADSGIVYYEGDQSFPLDEDTIVSMNMWGFMPTLFDHLDREFDQFLSDHGRDLKAEFLIPTVINTLVQQQKVSARVLESQERWFGMTYRDDRDKVINAIRKLVANGIYPASLWI